MRKVRGGAQKTFRILGFEGESRSIARLSGGDSRIAERSSTPWQLSTVREVQIQAQGRSGLSLTRNCAGKAGHARRCRADLARCVGCSLAGLDVAHKVPGDTVERVRVAGLTMKCTLSRCGVRLPCYEWRAVVGDEDREVLYPGAHIRA
jgi:hypothetical protein